MENSLEKQKRLYLAYGSNTNINQMAYRCPNAKPVGMGFIENYELLFRGFPGSSFLTIEPKEGSKVPFAMWELSEFCEKALDRYEGYPSFYHKENITVEVNGEKLNAMVYIMNDGYKLAVPSLSYLNGCKEGYDNVGLEKKYLDEALEKSRIRK